MKFRIAMLCATALLAVVTRPAGARQAAWSGRLRLDADGVERPQ
jgi:hypothetical protein